MSRITKGMGRWVAIATAVAVFCSSQALAKKPPKPPPPDDPPSYQIVPLDDEDDEGHVYAESYAKDINSQRQIVGSVYDDLLGGSLAACWITSEAGGVVQSDLHLLTGGGSAAGINQWGEIVGERTIGDQRVGLYWATKDDAPLELSPLDGDDESIPQGINKDGVICGVSRGSAATAVAWRINIDTGNPVVWGPVALPTIVESAAFGINDNNAEGFAEIVGYLTEGSNTPVVWTVQSEDTGELSVNPNFEILPGGDARAYGVNNLGAICGHTWSSPDEAVVWDGDPLQLQVLDRSKFVLSPCAYDINDNGVIVGRGMYQKAHDWDMRALVWPSVNGSMVLLDKFLDRHSPFIGLSMAQGVNEAGDIAGIGMVAPSTHRAFLAIPE